MQHIVHCKKLGITTAGLSTPPYPGELGQRIYDHISNQAWEMWISHQTMLINEYKLSLIDKKARDFLLHEMEKFLFGGQAEKPPGFTNPDKNKLD